MLKQQWHNQLKLKQKENMCAMHNMHMFIPHSRNFPAFNNSDVENWKASWSVLITIILSIDFLSGGISFHVFLHKEAFQWWCRNVRLPFLESALNRWNPTERWERVNNQGGEPAGETGLNELPPQLLEPTQCGHTQLPAHIEIHRSGPAAKVLLHFTSL